MPETIGASHRGAIGRALRRFAALDLSLSLMHAGMWVVLGFVALPVALASCGLRLLVVLAHARRRLGPALRWVDAGREASGEHGRAAAGALDGFAGHLAAVYLASWLVLDGVWIALGLAGVPVELPIGRAELLAAVMLGSSVLVAPLIVTPILEHSLADLHLEVRAAMPTQTPTDAAMIPHVVTRLVVMLLIASVAGLSGVGILLRTDAIREAAIAEQRRRAELSAIRIDGDLGEVLDGVELVERDRLPGPLAAALGQPGAAESVSWHDPRRERVFAAAPLADGRWALATARPDEQLGWSLISVLGFLVAVTPVIGVAVWVYGRTISLPLRRFIATMQQFATRGELRGLTRPVPLRYDEVGHLCASFNVMLDILEELARAAEAVAEGDLSVALDRSGELHDAFRGMLAQLNEIVSRMRETSLELASAAAEIHALMQRQDAAAHRQATGVGQVSATVASLADAARSITGTAAEVLDNAEQTVVTTDTVTERIAAQRGHAAAVTTLLEVIRELADRSDLLALNGSLEATRAGEAGRGFAIVAAEMRRLAERVTRTITDVRGQITDIEASGTTTVTATERSRALAQQTAAAARQIAAVTSRQRENTEEAARGVDELAGLVGTWASAVSQTELAAEALRIHATELERLIATFRIAETG